MPPKNKGPALTQKADSWTETIHTPACIAALKKWDEEIMGLPEMKAKDLREADPLFAAFISSTLSAKLKKLSGQLIASGILQYINIDIF